MSNQPRTLRYRQAVDAAEQRIVNALPEIVEGLIARAREGDLRASINLLDRILGKASDSSIAPADDRQAPYTDAEFEEDEQEREDNRRLFGVLQARYSSGAGKGA
jgi:hypothetical protein